LLKVQQIEAQEAARRAREAFDVQIAANDNQRDILSAQQGRAVTNKDRRALALRLLDLDEQEERARQEAVLASREASATEKQIAARRLATLDQLHGLRVKAIDAQSEGPLAAYLRDLSPDTINERIEGLVVDELQSVRNGINDGITNALGIKNPFLKGLIDTFLDQVLIRPIAETLERARQQSSGGNRRRHRRGVGEERPGREPGHDCDGTADPCLANGSSGWPGGPVVVGERGPELINLPSGAQVIPNHRMPQFASGGAARVINNYYTLPSDEFWGRVDGRVVAHSPAIIDGGRGWRWRGRRVTARGGWRDRTARLAGAERGDAAADRLWLDRAAAAGWRADADRSGRQPLRRRDQLAGDDAGHRRRVRRPAAAGEAPGADYPVSAARPVAGVSRQHRVHRPQAGAGHWCRPVRHDAGDAGHGARLRVEGRLRALADRCDRARLSPLLPAEHDRQRQWERND
jgi:hypothetical protein